MSKFGLKIKYKEEGSYGSIEEHTLFCISNGCNDITTFYDENGSIIFLFNDTIDDNIFDKMIELYKNWRNNPNVTLMNIDEFNKCK